MVLPRFHLHTLMIAVALVALAFPAGYEIERLWNQSIDHRRRADWMAEQVIGQPGYAAAVEIDAARYDEDAQRFATKAGHLEGEGLAVEADKWRGLAATMRRQAEGCRTTAELARRRAVYWARLKPRYDRAALFPFLPLTPDPPVPQ